MPSSSSSPGIAMTSSPPATAPTQAPPRTSPLLPTPLERIALGLFPVLLVFGTVFSIVSPNTRSATYDPIAQTHAHEAGAEPSYFARKSNLFNVVFVKRGWGWNSLALFAFAFSHASLAPAPRLKVQAVVRWAAATFWWFLVTQWCFGAPMIDRGFRWTGGKCDLAELGIITGQAGAREAFTAVACKAAGGQWSGGHDISGHVFLLVLGSALLMNEVLWPVMRWTGWAADARCVVMGDGALKGANVEAEVPQGSGAGKPAFGIGGKFAAAILGLNLWMLLMTAIYFHTWFEKVCLPLSSETRFQCIMLTCAAYGANHCVCRHICHILCTQIVS